MYALKAANPYYVIREWREDEKLGVSDHERRKQLAKLGDTMSSLPPQRQSFWATHLAAILKNDTSPEMRRLAVRAATGISGEESMEIIEQGLDDGSTKVRMEACRALGKRQDEEAARLLASTYGTETNQDVKHAAIAALANHRTPMAVDSLRLALEDRNPAARTLAVESLRTATGKNYGDDPEVWIAALDGEPAEQAPTRWADRLRSLF